MNRIDARRGRSGRRSSAIRGLGVTLILCTLVACASVKVRKVPTPSQYLVSGKSYWTPQMQAAADKMEGLRFYLPRPFINVFESFPVATDIYIAQGRVSPDGQYVAIDAIMPLSTREDFVEMSAKNARTLPSDLRIPKSWIFESAPTPAPRTPNNGSGEARSGIPGSITSDDGAPLSTDALNKLNEVLAETRDNLDAAEKQSMSAQAAATAAAAAAEKAAEKAAEASNAKTGTSSRKVTNDNGAFAYQPLRGNFDLIYLPDFDEQYVVSSESNLGNAQFELNLGQGWSLQGFNSFTDNSELTKRVFDVIDFGLEIAKSAARAAALAGGIPLPALNEARAGVAEAPVEVQIDRAPGSPVALKIVVVHYAAKGLYPVIKPREMISLGSAAMLIDLSANAPAVRRVGDIDMNLILSERARIERRSTVPVYPYQYVSFNTFRYMAIEVLKTSGTPFGTLYDKTGTTGDPGDRRAVEPPTPTPQPRRPVGTADTAEVEAALNAVSPGALDTVNKKLQAAAATAPNTSAPVGLVLELTRVAGSKPGVLDASGTLTWFGSAQTLTDAQKTIVRDALDAYIASDQNLTKANAGTPLRLASGFAYARLAIDQDLRAMETEAVTAANKVIDKSQGLLQPSGRPNVTKVEISLVPGPEYSVTVHWKSATGESIDLLKEPIQAQLKELLETNEAISDLLPDHRPLLNDHIMFVNP